MARKRPSSRDQKALTILDANLTPVQEKEDSLIAEIAWDLHLSSEMIRFIERGDPLPEREQHWESLKEHIADANFNMRWLRKFRKELS